MKKLMTFSILSLLILTGCGLEEVKYYEDNTNQVHQDLVQTDNKHTSEIKILSDISQTQLYTKPSMGSSARLTYHTICVDGEKILIITTKDINGIALHTQVLNTTCDID